LSAKPLTAVLDACALAGALQRNMLLSLAAAGFYRPRWSIETLTEAERAIRSILEKKGAADPADTAAQQRKRIESAFPEAAVKVRKRLLSAVDLPDKKDHHVLAAAVQVRAHILVTDNLTDFPVDYVGEFEIAVSTTDRFLGDLIHSHTPGAVAALRNMRLRVPSLIPKRSWATWKGLVWPKRSDTSQ
jgi:hypothetical protein